MAINRRRMPLAAVAVCSLLAGVCACDGSSAPASAPSGEPSASPAASAAPGPRPTTAPLPPGAGPLPAIPSVRSFRPGPDAARADSGWWPTPGARVVVEDGASGGAGRLAGEGRLLARELGGWRVVRGTAADLREGDVHLVLGRGAPAEGYTLVSGGHRLRITGSTDAGVFYGTRTALQALRALGYVPSGVAHDRPDRPQRGLTLDIARKHFSRGWIEARVREMGDLKLNQLHLHISDDQGFRIESTSHPEVVSPRHLTQRDVREIIDQAAARHITVVPEIDSPGHLGAVLKAHPELQLRNANGVPARGAVDISKPRAARIVDDLDREYARLFPGPYWHLGGDEYQALRAKDPQAAYPQLARYARARFGPGATIEDAATGWLGDRGAAVRRLGKREKAWNDGFFGSPRAAPPPGREAEYWTGRETGVRPPEEFLRAGRRLVNLNDEYLYYVLGEPHDFRYPTGERIYQRWTPAVLRGTEPVAKRLAGPDRVLGGRLAVWCDRPDAQSADQVARGIRMPLRAVAQKLWDPRRPALDWPEFARLADRMGPAGTGG